MPIILYIISACFMPQGQSWIVATESISPHSLKYLVWLFLGKGCWRWPGLMPLSGNWFHCLNRRQSDSSKMWIWSPRPAYNWGSNTKLTSSPQPLRGPPPAQFLLMPTLSSLASFTRPSFLSSGLRTDVTSLEVTAQPPLSSIICHMYFILFRTSQWVLHPAFVCSGPSPLLPLLGHQPSESSSPVLLTCRPGMLASTVATIS